MATMATRQERDSLGTYEIPQDALFGIQTARAVDNFPITGVRLNHFPGFVRALAMVKQAGARANFELGTLDVGRTDHIVAACQQLLDGQHHHEFVVDMIQGGAGTSTNMNANEVIANLAAQNSGREIGVYDFIHPNDHVKKSQSTNDVYPTAIRLAVLARSERLIDTQEDLRKAFSVKAEEFSDIYKVGRTQLQDAVPMTVGREFASFAAALTNEIERMKELSRDLKVINLGGTAIGTGVKTPKGYARKAVTHLSAISGYDLSLASDLVDASSDMGALVSFSGLLRRTAIKISKICNDLRLLSSGPRAGFGEIILPSVQAGSSIMPDKINPVIPEVVNQVAYQVIGNDVTITMAAEAGQLQLNAMEPVIAYNLLESMRVMESALQALRIKCVEGIRVDRDRCDQHFSESLVLTTALVPHLGYEASAAVAKEALKTHSSVREVVVGQQLMTAEEFQAAISSYIEHV